MKLTRNLVIAFGLGLILVVLADVILIATNTQKAELWGSSVVGYWAALGLLSFLMIVGVSKLIGDRFLVRPEDYYDETGADDDGV